MTEETSKEDVQLLTYKLPKEQLPGSDLLSKAILKEDRVMDLITRAILDVPNDTYTSVVNSEWNDGKRSDIVYIPRLPINKSLPPFLIEVQRTMSDAFMLRVIKYCINVNIAFERKPIVVLFCVQDCPASILRKFKPTTDRPWLHTCIANDFWAEHCFLITKRNMDLSVESPLEPLLALARFFIEQQAVLHQHSCPNDPTIHMLYSMAKDFALDGEQYELNFSDAIGVVCDTHIKQLKKAREAVSNQHKCIKIIDCLVEYDSKLKRRYSAMHDDSSSQGSLDEPYFSSISALSSQPSSSKRSSEHGVEKSFVIKFKENLNGARMDWVRCLAEGRAQGLFGRYSTKASLRVNYRKYT